MGHDVFSDTWVATDALGRPLPGWEECGSPRPNRSVGIFYFICNVNEGSDGPYDVSKIIAADPEHPWFVPHTPHYWGEPELGYYRSTDRWVIRKHAYLLADAGIDTLIFDTTNDVTYPDSHLAVCEVFSQIRAEGERTPGICFLASEQSAYQVWDALYSKGLYSDLWFRWQDKPLLIFGQWEKRGDMNKVVLPQAMQDFFTIRQSWAWDALPWYGEGGYHRWPWVAHYPQCIGWDRPGVAEQVPVAIAQHPLSNIGRSYHEGHQPPTDRYDLTPYTAEGLHFAEQWQRALAVDPEFVFVTGWNEWMAGGAQCTTTDQGELQAQWDFWPGAQLGRAGRPLKVGDIFFVDQYNQEFSRDAEPMRGGHTDNYYYQLVANVRRYKGVRPLPAASAPVTIDLDGSFAQWDGVAPEYRDHLYETLPRDEPGYAAAGRYANTTGRNEFVTCKVARDDGYIYFLACTRAPLTPSSDPSWMLLFLNTDGRRDTGWQGYNFLINWPMIDGGRTTVSTWVPGAWDPGARAPDAGSAADGWGWQACAEARYRAEGNRLMIAVPRAAMDLAGAPLAFDFHWSDNLQNPGDLEDFLTNGDSAPNRRFDYRYRE